MIRPMLGNLDSGILVESGIHEILPPESNSWALESGIQFKESGIPLTIGIQNPSSTDKDWNPVSGIWNLESGIHGVESYIPD